MTKIDDRQSETNELDSWQRAQHFSAARLIRLCVKELHETLRDRRTIVTLVFMPLLVYPLLGVAFQKFALTSVSSLKQVDIHLGVASEEAGQWLSRAMSDGQRLLDAKERNSAADTELPRIELLLADNVRRGVSSGVLDVGVLVLNEEPPPRADEPLKSFRCELLYRDDSTLSQLAIDHIQKRLDAINASFVAEANLDMPAASRLLVIESETASLSLTTLIPLILILMTITGAVYPAIDLTAGERERGTLETLMAAPVPRLSLLFAKYVAVLTVALFTATANLVSMAITLVATGLGTVVFGDAGLTPNLVAQVFALLILFAAFFSAILLAITSFARSFKEAQSYLIPVMLLALAPGMMSLMPDLKFSVALAVTPLANIVLLARDLFEGTTDPMLATVAVLSTLFYAFAALALAARIFGADAILYGSQATWSDLVTRPAEPRDEASIHAATACLAFLFPVYFLTASTIHGIPDIDLARTMSLPPSIFPPIDLTTRLIASAIITALVFVGIPVVAALIQRVRFAGAFQLRRGGFVSYMAAIILGFTLWPFAYEAFLLTSGLELDVASKPELQNLLQKLPELSPLILLPCLAVTPAVCEELFFRGYLFGAFRERMRPWQVIAFTAVIFGVFHVVASALSTERLIPSTMMGLVLGWVCYRTGSVIPGIVLHACHNGLLMMIVHYREKLEGLGWGVEEEAHLPAIWLAAAAGCVVIAAGLLVLGTRKRSGRGDDLPERVDERPDR